MRDGWIAASLETVVAGDLAMVCLQQSRDGGNGKPMPIRPGDEPYPRRRGWGFIGRVVGEDLDNLGSVLLERTDIVGRIQHDLIAPPVLVSISKRDMGRHGAWIYRRAEEGPSDRSSVTGARHLHDLLVAAAGGDHGSDVAIERVASCIGPETSVGIEPGTVGRVRAALMLEGHLPFSETVHRQLLDKPLPVPAKPSKTPERKASKTPERKAAASKHVRAEGTQERNGNGTTRPDRDRFVARWREQKSMVATRLRDGFVHRDVGQIVLGRRHEGFVEHGLRSNWLGPSARMFVAGCRKAKDLRGGNAKDVMTPLGPNKVLALDSPYIEGNRLMVSLIRIDLDLIFPTPEHALAAIRDVVDAGDLPCMPHLICGDVGMARIRTTGEDGVNVETIHPAALIRPHVWVILPKGSAVNAGPNGNVEPKRLLAGVVRGINAALLHLGADPAASPWLVRGKNPLSPYLWSAELNSHSWPTLAEWSDWVDTRIQPEVLSRQAAEIQSGLDKGPSNVAFSTWQKAAYDVLRAAHRAGDPAYLAAVQPSMDPDALAHILRERMPLATLDRDPSWSEAAAERVFDRVVSYASSSWDPARAEVVKKARGTMRHVTDGMTRRRAQSAAGARSVGLRADRTLAAMVEAYGAIVTEGGTPSQTAVATRAGVNRRTAVRRWSEVVEGCDFRCIDKKPTPAVGNEGLWVGDEQPRRQEAALLGMDHVVGRRSSPTEHLASEASLGNLRHPDLEPVSSGTASSDPTSIHLHGRDPSVLNVQPPLGPGEAHLRPSMATGREDRSIEECPVLTTCGTVTAFQA